MPWDVYYVLNDDLNLRGSWMNCFVSGWRIWEILFVCVVRGKQDQQLSTGDRDINDIRGSGNSLGR